ncbi:copper homeostasis protein CutC [Erwinia sp. OLTSP20]|uniref:copper homeostasis protein CutC n=1 Tax=unclassified Erwinia TaxID=2622719 RepID=UPI000C19A0C0|nr:MULTISPECIES: copper homeostasis protein CutC [unclassified Erwinia]PIJ50930.1 copper homeostasis protein CutC [Erwinia sp. OAMSP11]PIJ75943.1 copper homeostasis protein CutC [Erwinia sp. OLSSP12]PIJ83611.1 copper homeostasis protein CutC [Erwinia sp. OLCASP19]PIJ87467.1 copper homeostasis protein CutC [Erwinia sp. OLMTSP26]PIJ89015.1 copper homeostasis protein CutC [Erwinia sp. OLMDSP33]
MAKLEICCYGVDCAWQAEKAGADRVELCAAPAEGGLTPSAGMLRQARQRLTLPVHPIIRPRGGDFCYSAGEFSLMCDDISLVKELGFSGLVVGILDYDGHIDMTRMRSLMTLCEGMAVTFHRAFDLCHNPRLALQQLTDLGVARVLTSGQQQSAESGLRLLKELTELSRGPIIMAGAGVRMSNLSKFLAAGISELHSSASQQIASPMRYRKAGVTMCANSETDEFSRQCVDSEMVAAMKNVIATHNLAVTD